MTALERAFFVRVHQQTGPVSRELAASIIGAFRVIAEHLPESEIARLIADGTFDLLVASVITDAAIALAFRPVRTAMQRTLGTAVKYFARDLPLPPTRGAIAIQLDVLNPNVLDAMQTLDSKILPTLQHGVRETVRQAIAAGLEAGSNPRMIARGLRDVIGLSPAQELAVRNYRAELEAGQIGAAAARQLHDARFSLESLTPGKIDRIVGVYRANMAGYHAETVARTATLDAFRKGQHLAWQQAIDAGFIDGDRLLKTWMQVQRPTKRESHIPLHGETVPFHQRYSNGDMIPGEAADEWNCACLSRVHLRRAA